MLGGRGRQGGRATHKCTGVYVSGAGRGGREGGLDTKEREGREGGRARHKCTGVYKATACDVCKETREN